MAENGFDYKKELVMGQEPANYIVHSLLIIAITLKERKKDNFAVFYFPWKFLVLVS